MLSKTPAESFLTLQVVLNGIVSLHKHTSKRVFVVRVCVYFLLSTLQCHHVVLMCPPMPHHNLLLYAGVPTEERRAA